MIFIAAFLLAFSIFLIVFGSRQGDKIAIIVGVAFFICALGAGFISYLALSALGQV